MSQEHSDFWEEPEDGLTPEEVTKRWEQQERETGKSHQELVKEANEAWKETKERERDIDQPDR
jgi:hypothetical protein